MVYARPWKQQNPSLRLLGSHWWGQPEKVDSPLDMLGLRLHVRGCSHWPLRWYPVMSTSCLSWSCMVPSHSVGERVCVTPPVIFLVAMTKCLSEGLRGRNDLFCSWLQGSQSITIVTEWWSSAYYSGQETGYSDNRKGQGQEIAPNNMTPMMSFLLSHLPQFYHIAIIYRSECSW